LAQKLTNEQLMSIFASQRDLDETLSRINYRGYDNTTWGNLTSGFKEGLAGTVEGLGGFAKLLGAEEFGDYTVNAMQKYQNSLRPSGYNVDDFSLGEAVNPFSKFWSSGQGFRTIGSGLGSLATFAVPQLAGAKIASAIGATGKAAQYAGSIIPSLIEASAETGGVFNTIEDDLKRTGDLDEYGKQFAKEQALPTFGANLILSGASNLGGLALAMAKPGGKVLGKELSDITQKYNKSYIAGKTLGVAGTQGYEEVMQSRIADAGERSVNVLTNPGYLDYNPIPQSPEEGLDFFAGAIMGGGLGLGGHFLSPKSDTIAKSQLDQNQTKAINTTPFTNLPLLEGTNIPLLTGSTNVPLLGSSSHYGDNFTMRGNSTVDQHALDLQAQAVNEYNAGRITPDEFIQILNTATQRYQPDQPINITPPTNVPLLGSSSHYGDNFTMRGNSTIDQYALDLQTKAIDDFKAGRITPGELAQTLNNATQRYQSNQPIDITPFITKVPLLESTGYQGNNFTMHNKSAINPHALDLQTNYNNEFNTGRITPQEFIQILNLGTQKYQSAPQNSNIANNQPLTQDSNNQSSVQNSNIILKEPVTQDANIAKYQSVAQDGNITVEQPFQPNLTARNQVVENQVIKDQKTSDTQNLNVQTQVQEDFIKQFIYGLRFNLGDKQHSQTKKAAALKRASNPNEIKQILVNSRVFKEHEVTPELINSIYKRVPQLRNLAIGQQNLQFSESKVMDNTATKPVIPPATKDAYRSVNLYGEKLNIRDNPNDSDETKLVSKLAKMFNANKNVKFFTSESAKLKDTNGFYNARNQTIYINENSPKAFHWVFGHEFAHHMEQVNNEDWNKISDHLLESLGANVEEYKGLEYQGLIDDYRKSVGATKQKGYITKTGAKYTEERTHREIISDLVADRIANGKFLDDLAQMEQKSTGIFTRTVQYIKKMLSRMIRSSKSDFDKTNLQRVQNELNAKIDSVLADLSQRKLHGQYPDNIKEREGKKPLTKNLQERQFDGKESDPENVNNKKGEPHYQQTKLANRRQVILNSFEVDGVEKLGEDKVMAMVRELDNIENTEKSLPPHNGKLSDRTIEAVTQALERNRLKHDVEADLTKTGVESNTSNAELQKGTEAPDSQLYDKIEYKYDELPTNKDFYDPSIYDFDENNTKDSKYNPKDASTRIHNKWENEPKLNTAELKAINMIANNSPNAHKAKQYIYDKYIKRAVEHATKNVYNEDFLPNYRADANSALLKFLGNENKLELRHGKHALSEKAKKEGKTESTAATEDFKKGFKPYDFKWLANQLNSAVKGFLRLNPNATKEDVDKFLSSSDNTFRNSLLNDLERKVTQELSETKKEFDDNDMSGISYADIKQFNDVMNELVQDEGLTKSGKEATYLDAAKVLTKQGVEKFIDKYHRDYGKYPSQNMITAEFDKIRKANNRKAHALTSYSSRSFSFESMFDSKEKSSDKVDTALDNANDDIIDNVPVGENMFALDTKDNPNFPVFNALTKLLPGEYNVYLAKYAPLTKNTLDNLVSKYKEAKIEDRPTIKKSIDKFKEMWALQHRFSNFSKRIAELNDKIDELTKLNPTDEHIKNVEKETDVLSQMFRRYPNEYRERLRSERNKFETLIKAKDELAKAKKDLDKVENTLANRLGYVNVGEMKENETTGKTELKKLLKKQFRPESKLGGNSGTQENYSFDDIMFSESTPVDGLFKDTRLKLANSIKKALDTRDIPQKNKLGMVQRFLRSPHKIAEIFPEFKKVYDLAVGSFESEQRLKTKFFERLNPIFDSLNDNEKAVLDDIVLAANASYRDLSDAEIKKLNGNDNVVKAYRDLRSHLDTIHKNLNRINKLMGRPQIGYVRGYFPHIWDNWSVVSNGASQSFRTHTEALEALKEIIKTDPNAVIKFTVPHFHNKATYSTEKTYELDSDARNEMLQEFTLGKDDIDALPTEIDNLLAKRDDIPTQHRFFSHLLKRQGMEGYSTDVRRVLSQYTNRSARYMALEPFKTKSLNAYNEHFGEFEKESSDALAKYTKQFILDFNGNPSNIEEYLNRVIGQIPYLADFLRKHSSYGDRYAVALANGATEVMAVTTLGFFNLATAFVQLGQLMNVFSLVGKGDMVDVIKRYNNLTNTDKWVLKASGVAYNANMSNTSGYAKGAGKVTYNNKLQALANKSMWLFNKGDTFTREIAVLSAYQKALRENGGNKKEALAYAKKVNRTTNFDYSVTDATELFRSYSVLGQVFFQFKKYGVKQGEFVYDMLFDKNNTKEQRARFFGSMFIMAGMMGIPFGDLLDELFKGITGKDVNSDMRNYLLTKAGNNEFQKALTHQAIYGAGSHVGIDLSKRIGIYNSFPDSFAPAVVKPIQAMQSLFKHGVTSPEFLGNVVPTIGNIATGYQGHPKGIKNLHYNNYEKVVRAMGFIPLRENIERDKRIYAMKKKEEKTNGK